MTSRKESERIKNLYPDDKPPVTEPAEPEPDQLPETEPPEPPEPEPEPEPEAAAESRTSPPGADLTRLEWSMEAERDAEQRYRTTGEWNLQHELDLVVNSRTQYGVDMYPRPQDKALGCWWVWCKEYQVAAAEAARADVDYDRKKGRRVFLLRQQGERSAEVAMDTALAFYDEVFYAKLARDLAKARVEAANQNMKRLSAFLDDQRTQEANRRAMEAHATWTQPS